MNNISIHYRKNLTVEEVIPIYESNGWSSANKPDLLIKALNNSHSLVSARINNRLVGLGNAISDGFLTVYFPHLIVHKNEKNSGIGTIILKTLLKEYNHFHMIVVLADSNTSEFYTKMGFNRAGRTVPLWIYSGNEH